MKHRVVSAGFLPGLREPRASALGPEGKFLAVLSRDEWGIWDLESSTREAVFPIEWERDRLHFEDVSVSRNGRCFAIAIGARVMIYELDSRSLTDTRFKERLTALELSPNGTMLAALGESSRIFLLRRDAEQLLLDSTIAVPFPLRTGSAFAWSPDGCRIAVATPTSAVSFNVIDVESSDIIQLVQHPGFMMMHVTFSGNGLKLVAIAIVDKPFTALVWDLLTGELESQTRVQGPEDGLHDQALDPCGDYFASIREADKTIQIQSIRGGKVVSFGENLGRRVRFGGDGCFLSAWDFEDRINLWELDR